MENGGLYWHLVDIIWIYLFPLLYLIDRNLPKVSAMSSEKSEHSEHVLPSGPCTWGSRPFLIILTFVTAPVANIDLGRFNTVVALVIATFKASVVVLFFMHVKYTSEKLTKVVIFSAIFLGDSVVLEYGGLRYSVFMN